MARYKTVCRTVRRRKSSGKPRRSTKVCVRKKSIVKSVITGLGLAGAFGVGMEANRRLANRNISRRYSRSTSRLGNQHYGTGNGNGRSNGSSSYRQGTFGDFFGDLGKEWL